MAVPIRCSDCGSSYRIPTPLFASRFEGRETSIKCRQCGAAIRVDARTTSTSAASLRAVAISTAADADSAPAASLDDDAPEITVSAIEPPQSALSTAPLPQPTGVREPSRRECSARHQPLAPRPPPRRARTGLGLVAVSGTALLITAVWAFGGRPPVRASSTSAAAASSSESLPATAPIATPAETAPAAPAATPPASAGSAAPRHDARALEAALTWASSRAEECHRGGRPSGVVQVTLTFAPTGRVSAVSLDGEPIASSPVSHCIRAYLRAALIPAFSGEALTVTRELTLR